MALTHAASTPNVPTPQGGMSHDKMLSFVSGIASKGLQHFDAGGLTLPAATGATGNNNTTAGGLGGGLSNLFGSNNQFQAQGAPIQAGTTSGQLNNAYSGAQGALGIQQGITNTLNTGLNQGAGNESNLANMYANQAAGGGPNPALTQLNQTTGQNIAQQAALAAGQRGAGANAGLIAAQNAQQGAATQQNAVGQAATLGAQQQLAAESNLQNLSANQVAQGTGATQTLNNAQQNEQNILQGANTAANNANVAQQSNINNVNAGISTANANTSGSIVGGLLSGVSSIAGLFAHGGEVGKDRQQVEHVPWVKKPQMLAGGGVTGQATSAPQSYVGQWLNSSPDIQSPLVQQTNLNTAGSNPLSGLGGAIEDVANALPVGLNAESIASQAPGLSTGASDLSNMGGLENVYKGGLMKSGGKVNAANPAQKAVKSGDSLQNDKVPAMLSQGELVIDRDTMKDPGPMGQMARALEAHINKKKKTGK